VLGLVAGCAGALGGPHPEGTSPEASQGWRAIENGNTERAAAGFARALAHDPSDARALFGAANLAYEHGDDEAALGGALGLLDAASRGTDPTALALSAATLARVPRLLAEIPDRRPAEERLIALPPGRLPWQAQYALALTVIDIARKRADATLLARAAAAAGCARAIDHVGEGGRLPLLDLSAGTFRPLDRPRPLAPAGCQFQLNTPDGRMGIKVLRSEFDLPDGRYDVVLDFAGPARVRVDGGPWHEHGGSLRVHGPRWSALPVSVVAGKHGIEIRLGTYGASAELALLAIPSAKPPQVVSVDAAGADEAMLDLARALEANLAGETDVLLARIDRLVSRPRFTLGQAAAGRLYVMDPTRPVDITRDKARSLWRQALAIDPGMARVWLDLSDLEMRNERPREAAQNAEQARLAAPGWWPAQLGAATALRAQGLEQPADAALDQGLALAPRGFGACDLVEKAFLRKREREESAAAGRLVEALGRCDTQNVQSRSWAQEHGDTDKLLALLARAVPTSAEPWWLRSEIADARLARGEFAAAHKVLSEMVELAPRDTRALIRLADSETALGSPEQSRATLARAIELFPGRQDLRQAGRLAGLALPLDDFRLDGAKVVRDFLRSGRTYQAPAVVVLDRAVERVFSDGTALMLTHTITQVLSKDAVEHVGEVQVPGGAEILVLRTRKADGTLREAEEIAGKSSISAPNLGVGDFVESETLEVKEPREAFAPGFIGERFYFRSFDAPLDRSEFVFIAPSSMRLDVNQRAGAPPPVATQGKNGTRILTFVVREQPQIFSERSAVPAVDWIPSVRVSSGASLELWSRFVAERFARVARGSPELRRVAADIAGPSGGDRGRLAEAIAAWVSEHIEPEADYVEPATSTLARGRGNRAGLMVALAHSLGIPADLVLARSLLSAAAGATIAPSDLDDFRDVLVRFPRPGADRFVDPQLRRAPFGYLPAGLDGADAVVVGGKEMVKAVSRVNDRRGVTLRARLDSDGSARVAVTEDLSGWPAVEWSEMLERAGKDRTKLRQGFEQHWLGQHFPGAQLDTLVVDAGGAQTRVKYTFTAARMADRQAGVLRLRPVFFQAQPGRRFATEPERKTALMLGYDVPLELDAEFALPAGAKVLDVGQGGEVIAGQARFVEERRVKSDAAGLTISLRRQSRLPIMRVEPGDYPAIAVKLRAVDPLEQGEIRIAVPGQ
jgi:tetratricopeptide (TPR) repeat protein